MPGKSKGRLIHDSEFVGPKGRIRVLNNKGIFIPDNPNLDTRQIIYLGLNRDPQQDIKQLLVQVTRTLNIFEQKYPNYIAILIFDQSSIYALYNKGILNTFSINKTLGGVKKGNIKPYRRDTYFLLEYIIPGLQGTI